MGIDDLHEYFLGDMEAVLVIAFIPQTPRKDRAIPLPHDHAEFFLQSLAKSLGEHLGGAKTDLKVKIFF